MAEPGCPSRRPNPNASCCLVTNVSVLVWVEMNGGEEENGMVKREGRSDMLERKNGEGRGGEGRQRERIGMESEGNGTVTHVEEVC